MRILYIKDKVKEDPTITVAKPQVPTIAQQSIAIRQVVHSLKEKVKQKDKDNDK